MEDKTIKFSEKSTLNSDFPTMVRIGGLSSNALEIVSDDLRLIASQLASENHKFYLLKQQVINICHNLVPKLCQEKELRRAVINGKRAVFHGKPVEWTSIQKDAILSFLNEDDATILQNYLTSNSNLLFLLDNFASAVAESEKMSINKLYSTLKNQQFFDSLCVAAPTWIKNRTPHLIQTNNAKDIKTLVAYVSRAVTKPSPFSGLSPVGIAGTKGEANKISRINVTISYLVLLALVRNRELANAFSFTLPPVIGNYDPGNHDLAIVTEMVSSGGLAWRDDRIVFAQGFSHWTSIFGDKKTLTLEDILTSIGGENPFDRFLRLMDQGILRVVVPWSRIEDPLKKLLSLFSEPRFKIIHDLLKDLSDRSAHFAFVTDAQRIKELEMINQDLQKLNVQCGTRLDLVFEDVETDTYIYDPLGDETLKETLYEFVNDLRPFIFRSHVYDYLVHEFVSRIGSGRRVKAFDFFAQLSLDRDQNPGLIRALELDTITKNSSTERAWLYGGLSSAKPNLGLMFQTFDSQYGQSIVVNNFSSGTGALFSRFTSLLRDDFKEDLVFGVKSVWGSESVKELTFFYRL